MPFPFHPPSTVKNPICGDQIEVVVFLSQNLDRREARGRKTGASLTIRVILDMTPPVRVYRWFAPVICSPRFLEKLIGIELKLGRYL